MISIVLRIVMVGVVVWALWKIYTALYPARRPRTDASDDWQDVLEAIDELPEATEPQGQTQDHHPLVPILRDPPDDSVPILRDPPDDSVPILRDPPDDVESTDGIESVIIQEAEVALALVREGDEDERLAAYYEITTYEKLCSIAEPHISEATRKRIGDIYDQALELICPPDGD